MKSTFRVQVRRSSVVVKVYHQKVAGVYTLAHHEEGQRKRALFGELAAAREVADNVADRLSDRSGKAPGCLRLHLARFNNQNLAKRNSLKRDSPWNTASSPPEEVRFIGRPAADPVTRRAYKSAQRAGLPPSGVV